MAAQAAVFCFRTPNIGDDVQAFAALSHLERVGSFADRDNLDRFAAATRETIVFNSWFLIPRKRRARFVRRIVGAGQFDFPLPNDRVDPIFFGFCLGRPELLDSGWRDYLKSHAPIGCRDLTTVERLRAADIEAFWTGCLTMFAGRRFAEFPAEERRETLLVDIDAETEARFVPKEIARSAVRLTAFVAPSIRNDPLLRLAASARMYERLRRARLVVTRRLHVALPCVGLGTPVVAIPDPTISDARARFSGFERIIPVVFKDQPELAGSIDWSHIPLGAVPDELEASYAAFSNKLNAQVGLPLGREATIHSTRNVTIANPGLGLRPGRLFIQVGRGQRELRVLDWNEHSIELGLQNFAGLSRMAIQAKFTDSRGASTAVAPLRFEPVES